MLIKASGITDVGLKRERNEDAFFTDDEIGLYLVADGMGGHLAGEVASRIAVEIIAKTFRVWKESNASLEFLYGRPDASLTTVGNYLLSAIRLANKVIHELAAENEHYHGMGTTVGALVVIPNLVIAANVGDSRLYMIRNGRMEMLSRDHTIVAEQVEMGIMAPEEAQKSPLKHVLTRNLGSGETVEPEVFEIVPANGDRYLLCTDGLTDLVGDEEILETVTTREDPGSTCRDLVKRVLKRGAHDNTTVVAVFLSGLGRPRSGPFRKMAVQVADGWIGLQKLLKRIRP